MRKLIRLKARGCISKLAIMPGEPSTTVAESLLAKLVYDGIIIVGKRESREGTVWEYNGYL